MAVTPLHKFRAPMRLWREFGDACEAQGTDRSKALVAYMRRYVAAWKGRQGKDHGDTPD